MYKPSCKASKMGSHLTDLGGKHFLFHSFIFEINMFHYMTVFKCCVHALILTFLCLYCHGYYFVRHNIYENIRVHLDGHQYSRVVKQTVVLK
jgi:hypothetical protein